MNEAFRILVIEDDDQDYRLLIRHLESRELRFTADRAANGAALHDLLDAGRDDWTLILADYSVPDIDIRTKLHWLLGRLPNTPIILVSGTIGEERAVDLLREGIDDFVNKGNLARLVPAMERAVAAVAVRRARKAAEAELELRNRALDAASNGVVITSADGDMPMVYVNPAFVRITGYPAEELLGVNCRLLQGDDREQAALEAIRGGVARREACTAELRNYRKDGTLFWNRLSIAPVEDRHGRITHFVGVQEDITDSVNKEQRLRQSATVFDNAQEGMTVTELDGTIIEVNRAFSEITGYRRDEIIGSNPRILQSGRHDRGFYQAMWASLQESGRWSGEVWNRRKSGEVYPQLLTISVVRDECGRACNYVGVFADISKLKQSEEQLEYLAHHDPLTGLPNRLLFNARLHHAVEQARRNNYLLAVLFLDLDRFKNINDAHGHTAGDELLRQVGERLGRCVRTEDTIARIGGDEFIILLERLVTPEHASLVAEKIQRAFTAPFTIEGMDQYVTASIGIGSFPRDAQDSITLVRNADTALYRVKEHGRKGYRFYSPEYTAQAAERAALENDLYKAVEGGQLRLHYQPQVDLHSGAITGVEALVRWEHPVQGLMSPGLFIPIAEESGLILDIGGWVLETACRQARRWLDSGLDFGRMSVNIAGQQIRKGDLHLATRDVLRACGLPPGLLELEVTEGFIMKQAEQGITDLQRLRDLGVGLAIDDFGTGYSSLSYLKRLPVDRLKLDQSFVRDLPDDPEDAAIAAAVIALAGSLGLDIIAEGVETEEQRRFLLEEGCGRGQGYLFSRPLPPEALLEWAARHRRQMAVQGADRAGDR